MIRPNKTWFWQPLWPLWPHNSLWGQIWPQIWNEWPQLPTYPWACYLYGISPLAVSEVTTASKQPRRSNLSVQVKLATPIYYMTKFKGTFISQISLMSPGYDDKQGPLTCVALPQVIRPQLPPSFLTHSCRESKEGEGELRAYFKTYLRS